MKLRLTGCSQIDLKTLPNRSINQHPGRIKFYSCMEAGIGFAINKELALHPMNITNIQISVAREENNSLPSSNPSHEKCF